MSIDKLMQETDNDADIQIRLQCMIMAVDLFLNSENRSFDSLMERANHMFEYIKNGNQTT